MSGMLGRTSTALVTSEVYNNNNTNLDSSKRFCKAWPRSSSDQSSSSLLEPTSVLDIRSPSPSSTLSSSLAGSCEGGLGSIESGAVAVSGLFCEGASEGQQLPDCSTSLLESHSHSHGHGQVRSVQEEIAGAWQQQGSHPITVVGDVRQQGWAEATNNSDGMMKQQQQQIVSSSPSPSPLFEQGISREQGSFCFPIDKIVKSEAIADGSLEACVMPFSCRKRDREDFLGEVVQRTGHGQHQEVSWAGSEWCDVKPSAIDELDEILVGSPAPPLSEFWLPETANSATAPSPAPAVPSPSPSPLQLQQQQQNHQQQGFANRGKQLDLYEAVQAGLLYRGSSSAPAPTASSSELGGALLNPNLKQQEYQAVLPQMNSIPRVGHGHVSQFLTQREQSNFSLRPMQLPYRSPGPFMDTKPAMFNQAAPIVPPTPQFGEIPTNYPFPVPQPQFVPPKPEFVPDIKQCSIPRIIEGDPKIGGGGGIGVGVGGGIPQRWPPMQKPPETGWQPSQHQPPIRLPPGLGGFSVPEPPLLPHQRRELQVGRRVRVEELSLAEGQLSAAAEAAGHGDLVTAQAILARLNQQSSPKGQQQQQLLQPQQQQTPSQRVVFLFTEAMSKRMPAIAAGAGAIVSTHDVLTYPADIIGKISAYKSFCEVSPIPQFAHFTANQSILEATEGEDCVHLIDFELGLGGQWASFMQEFAQRRAKAELRITTIGGETVEMKLAKENLQQFAKEVGLKLEVIVLGVDRLEMIVPGMLRRRKDDEAVVVNFGFGMRRPAAEFRNGVEGAMAFLNMIKALSPKVVTVIDSDGELGERSSMLEAMQYYACIFESLDGTKLARESVVSIENLVFGPKIAEVVALRVAPRRPDGLFSGGVWRFLLQKAGFSVNVFSPAAQSQAACLVKSPANSGFNFHSQQGPLQLSWYNKNLITASAWV